MVVGFESGSPEDGKSERFLVRKLVTGTHLLLMLAWFAMPDGIIQS